MGVGGGGIKEKIELVRSIFKYARVHSASKFMPGDKYFKIIPRPGGSHRLPIPRYVYTI